MLIPDELSDSGKEKYFALKERCETRTQLRLDDALMAMGEPLRCDALLYLIETMNREQLAALLHNHCKDGPLLILAGAGSGKTAVLTRRVVYLLLAGVEPHAIFTVTFTNKAANEMRERVKGLLQSISEELPDRFQPVVTSLEVASDDMWIGTFHSTCLRILEDKIPGSDLFNIERLGFRPTFKVMDPLVSRALIEQAMEETGPTAQSLGLEFFMEGIEKARNELRSPDTIRDEGESGNDELLATVQDKYQALKRGKRLIDFNDIICFAVELLQQDKEVSGYYCRRFEYVLIDEYQDTNFAQYVLARQLSAGTSNIFVVGDDDQSIYGWRGADIRNILNFREDYPDSQIIKLVKNYRSTRLIIAAANHIFDNFKPAELRKELEPVRTDDAGETLEGEKIVVYTAEDDHDEARFCAFIISQEKAAGRPYGDCAIFYRTNDQARVIKEVLDKEEIPYLEFGDHRFFTLREVDNTLNYLKLIDMIAQIRLGGAEGIEAAVLEDASRRFQRLLALPWFGFSPEAQAAADHFLDAYRVLTDDRQYAALQKRLGQSDRLVLDKFIDEFYRQLNRASQCDLLQVLDGIWAHLGYSEEIMEGGAKGRSLRKNLDAFAHLGLTYQRRFSAEPGFGFLRRFLADLEEKRRDPQSLAGGGGDSVLLMTLHSSKGLEFPVVFFTGLEDGICPYVHPSERDMKEEDRQARFEEELRLFYVGVTRARERLYLLRAKCRTQYGRQFINEPSPFLKLIPAHTRERGDFSGGLFSRALEKLGGFLSK